MYVLSICVLLIVQDSSLLPALCERYGDDISAIQVSWYTERNLLKVMCLSKMACYHVMEIMMMDAGVLAGCVHSVCAANEFALGVPATGRLPSGQLHGCTE